MEPNMSAPRPAGEVGPLPRGPEVAPRTKTGEAAQPRHIEQAPSYESRESLPAPSGGGPQPQSPIVPQSIVPPVALQAAPATAPVVDNNPVAANDEDLIEKEWVDRAKKIIASTKNDPYLQEREVSKLQADYLKKRYGKDVKLPVD